MEGRHLQQIICIQLIVMSSFCGTAIFQLRWYLSLSRQIIVTRVSLRKVNVTTKSEFKFKCSKNIIIFIRTRKNDSVRCHRGTIKSMRAFASRCYVMYRTHRKGNAAYHSPQTIERRQFDSLRNVTTTNSD